MNAKVLKWEIPNDPTIIVTLENGIEIHLTDDSDRYECMQISATSSASPLAIIV